MKLIGTEVYRTEDFNVVRRITLDMAADFMETSKIVGEQESKMILGTEFYNLLHNINKGE